MVFSGRKSSGGGKIGRSAPSRKLSTSALAVPSSYSVPSSHSITTQPQLGSMLSGITDSIVHGMAVGTGSAIADRAIDSIMGPRTIVHEHVNKPAQASGICQTENNNFQKCLRDNNNVTACQFYLDVLSQCQRDSL